VDLEAQLIGDSSADVRRLKRELQSTEETCRKIQAEHDELLAKYRGLELMQTKANSDEVNELKRKLEERGRALE
jgi:hypothetical protein